MIFQITYDKEAEEYKIKEKAGDDEFLDTYTDVLNEEEKAFCRGCKNYNQTPYKIVWSL